MLVDKYTNASLQNIYSGEMFYIVLKMQENHCPLRLKVRLDNCFVFINESAEELSNKNTAQLMLSSNEDRFYSWSKINQTERRLFAVVYNTKLAQRSNIIEIDLNKHEMNYMLEFGASARRTIYHSWKVKGISKHLIISDLIDENMLAPKPVDTKVVRLPKLGISLIDGIREDRKELMYITMKDLQYLNQVNTDENITQYRVRYLNIDNSLDEKPLYPVIFTPAYNLGNLETQNLYWLDVVITKAVDDSNITAYNMISADLMPTKIKLEEKMIPSIIAMSNNYNNDLRTLKEFFSFKYIALRDPQKAENMLEDQFTVKGTDNWINQKELTNNNEAYINNIAISRIKLNFSFQKEYGMNETDKLFQGSLGLIGVLLNNIDDADFIFDPVRFSKNCIPQRSMNNMVVAKYKQEGISNAFRAIGSLNFIGNPVKIYSEVTEGFDDFQKPLNSFDHRNPLSVGGSLLEGTGSMVKHTAGAATGALSRVSKSLADFAGVIHNDHRYNKERMVLRHEKTEGIGAAFGKSARQFGGGLKSAVTGLVSTPADYIEREGGITGAIKGTVFGVAGLITKPISGAFDAFSTITGGISRETKNPNLVENDERLRQPRAFYGENKRIL